MQASTITIKRTLSTTSTRRATTPLLLWKNEVPQYRSFAGDVSGSRLMLPKKSTKTHHIFHATKSSTVANTLQHECHFRSKITRSFSSNTSNSNTRTLTTMNTTIDTKGDEMYQLAIETMEQAEELEKKHEKERSDQIHDAIEKAKEAEKKPQTQGVVVVKTIAKQARKKNKQHLKTTTTRNDDENVDESSPEYLKQKANEYMEIAAYEYNHPIALVQLGTIALQEANKVSNTSDDMLVQKKELVYKAMELFQKAGEVGYRVGWYNLGQLLWSGYPTSDHHDDDDDDDSEQQILLEPDIEKALNIFEKAIELGDPDAMYLVGVHRMSIFDNDDDNELTSPLGEHELNILQSGLQLIQQAAEIKHHGAIYYLALLALNGEDKIGLESNINQFQSLLNQAIELNNYDAQFVRGHCYYYGTDGYEQNYNEALNDFLQAGIDGKNSNALISAGSILHNGIPNEVLKDQTKAFELYQLAGEYGSKEGWMNVIACYIAGEGVKQSYDMAEYIAKTMLHMNLSDILNEK